jgi:hypothetical protein
MSDFLSGIRRAVQAARESTKQQQDAQRREEEKETARQKQNEQSARELRESIWDRIREVEAAADGAITIERTGDGARETFQLAWQEGQPKRTLQVVVDEAEGSIQGSWVLDPGAGRRVDAPSVEASRFEMAQLEMAIELLVDQRRWARGGIPMIPW